MAVARPLHDRYTTITWSLQVLNGPDPEAADNALYMGKSYCKYLKGQIKLIPRKAINAGSVIIKIPQVP